MSMKGSPIGWFKEKRQSSYSGSPNARRPATALPLGEDRDMAKTVEQAVLAAFASDAFKMAVASQVDPAFARHQERLNQIRTTNLNLESTLQSHVEDIPELLETIQNHLTSLVIPDYRQDLDSLGVGQEKLERKLDDLEVPEHGRQLSDIASAQSQLLKTLESRFDGLASRIDEFDRKLGELEGSVVSADLRSAIRFGEISNELQDRNTTLGDRLWGVEREMGKKVDALQRKVVAACEEVGKSVRSTHEAVELVHAKLDEDDVLAAVNKGNSRAEFSEKAFRRSIAAIQDKVANFDASVISSQTARLEVIERGVSDFKKEAEAARNLASVSSKFLSANTSKLDNIAAAVGKIQITVDSTSESCQEVSESLEQNASSIKEDVEAVRMHVRALDSLAVSQGKRLSEATNSVTRMESTLIERNATAISRLEDLESSISRVEDGLKPLSAHTMKLENLQTNLAGATKEIKPHRAILDDLTSILSELRSNVDTAISSHSESLETIQQKVCDTSKVDLLASSLSQMQSQIEQKISSSLESTSRSTIEQINSHMGVVDLKLQAGFNSVTEHASHHAEKSVGSITELLQQVRSTQAYLGNEKAEISEQFRSMRELVEANQAAHKEDAISTRQLLQDAHEASKDDEILLQIESWTEKCISKQAAEIASVKEILESSRGHGEVLDKSIADLGEKSAQISEFLRSGDLESSSSARELAAIKSILENGTTLAAVKESASTTEQAIRIVQASLQELQGDSTTSRIEQLVLQSVASMATAHESINAIGSKITSSEEAIQATVREVQTALATNVSGATMDIKTSTVDTVAGLKTDLSSTVTSSMDALSAEVKAIDLSSTTTALESLKEQVLLSSQASQDKTHLAAEKIMFSVSAAIESLCKEVQNRGDTHSRELQQNVSALSQLEEVTKTALASNATNSEQLTTIQQNIEVLKREISTSVKMAQDHTELAAEGVKSSIATAIELLTTDVRDFGNVHTRELQHNATSLTNLEELAKTHSASISEQLVRIQKSIDPISEVPDNVTLLLTSVKELDRTAKSNAMSLSSMQESILACGAELGTVSTELKTAIEATGSKTLLAVEGSHAIVSELRQASEDRFGKVLGGIEEVDATLVKIAVEVGHANASLTKLSTVCQDIPVIMESAREFEAVQLGASKESKASQAAILDTVAGTAAVLLSVRSDVGGIVGSLGRAHRMQDAASEAQARILSVLETNSTDLHDIEETVKQGSVYTKELSETLASSISGLETSILASNAESKTTVISEIAALGSGVTREVSAINTSLERASSEREESLEALQLGISGLKKVVVEGSTGSRTIILSELEGIASKVSEEADKINSEFEKAAKEWKEGFETSRLEISALASSSVQDNAGLRAVVMSGLESIKSDITSGLEGIHNGSETAAADIKSSTEAIRSDIAELSSHMDERAGCSETAIISELTFTKLELVNRTQELHAVVAKSAVDADKAQDSLLSSLRSEARSIGEAVAVHADRSEKAVESKLEAAQVSIFLEVENTKKALNTDLFAIQSSIKESRDSLDTIFSDVSAKFDFAASESAKRHEVTRATLALESKSISDLVLREIQSANGVVDLAKGSVVAEIENTRNSLGSSFKSNQESLQECIECLKTEIVSGLKDVSSNSTKAHEATVVSMQTDSKLLLDTVLREVAKTNEAVEDFKQTASSASEATQAWLESIRGSLGTISENLSNEFKAAANERRDVGEIQDSQISRLADSVQQQRSESRGAVEAAHQELLSGFGGITKSLATMRDILEERTDTLANSLNMGFSDATVQRTTATKAREADTAALSGSIKREAETTRIALESAQDGINSVSAHLDTIRQSIKSSQTVADSISGAVSRGFAEASTQQDEASRVLTALSTSVLQEASTTRAAVCSAQEIVTAEVQKVHASLGSSVQTSADATQRGFANATYESAEARKALDSHSAILSASITSAAEATSEAVDALQKGIAADVKKTTLDLQHTLGGLQLHLEQISDTHKTTLAGLGEEMRCLDGQTHDRLGSLEVTSVQQHAALLSTIDKASTSLHHSLDGLRSATGAVDAAVRVNSAAIARVDKAVLESSSQLRHAIADSARELLSSLDEELQETGRRVRSITEIEMPRLETLARRNRDAVEVIGGRVIGTAKKFDEMVAHHGQKPANALERSDMLSASGRLRGGSNASSTRSRDSSYRISAMEIARDMARG
ncbi:hypothetical protein B2J93_3741 [Marssonina coronariae]|uniref:Uncharacterized protein n=1 Tax=Diplocarpon coronariae TaxID=2795749 RepID=A0A218YY62_9HELO|nr:hypothetical protein B2J93_3741 [Marssonina coronariae]